MDRLKLIILTTPHRLSDRTWHFTATDPKTGKRYHCSTSNWRISRCGVFDEIEVTGVLGGEELIERFSAFDNHTIINVDYYVTFLRRTGNSSSKPLKVMQNTVYEHWLVNKDNPLWRTNNVKRQTHQQIWKEQQNEGSLISQSFRKMESSNDAQWEERHSQLFRY